MFDPKTNLEEMMANVAKAGQSWFNNLIGANTVKSDNDLANGFMEMYQKFFQNTGSYIKVQQEFYHEQMIMWQNFFNEEKDLVATEIKKPLDKRFVDVEWENNPFFSYLKQSYLKMSEYLVDYVTKSDVDEETKRRLKFFMGQYLDAISPTNFALTNPEVIKSAVETGGMSLVEGMKNMANDISSGYMKMTDEKIFAIGKNLAVTKGSVVFRNELIEIIEYAPSTEKIFKTPLLIIPPCINKYYILDLQQENSLVKYLVDQGYNVFLISWKSADQSMRTFRFEEYINLGVISALEVVRSITKVDKVNTLGYCLGGIILTTAAVVMKERGLDYINSIGQMTVMLDHADSGDIKYFIDKDLLALEAAKKSGGIMSGRIIAQTFSALRANEMIWNYWVNNYLLGKVPQPFDILYWNNDAVDLPVSMHSFLLNRLYARNELIRGKIIFDGIKIDLSKINYPFYLFAAQKDHIVPWKAAFKSTEYLKGDIRFVLGASGHTAGVVNPVSSNKRNYWVNENINVDADTWFKNAVEVPGSWWADYNIWLKKLSGGMVNAPQKLGNGQYPVIMDAPGLYVLAKAMPLSVASMA